ncbi:Bgt-4570 [Blumeria graminis f. sp. tritici]|uniref:Bgt-4570 n=2 Tax=Blumeria graminis f. sp. tritici TaxID=62690 RepID=A0A061HF51_BLUGR|nr:hypothetical protein BGT96224_4570 [Blumeria graminis f. sp. tritici 96224]VDB84048.1 Bgt-4570 [Blumeria graminis f. sp. tritici]
MVKALTFKGDKKIKKRKRIESDDKFPKEGFSAASEAHTVKAVDDNGTDDDSWISAETSVDVVGPVVIVLPSESPTCIACDSSGKVYASELENIIDKNPASAEPHDVRQVWVANRVAGTESLNFKGHHGKYLGCDKFGLLSSNSEAVSPSESFLAIPSVQSPGTFEIQTLRGSFLTVAPPSKSNAGLEIRGDAEEASSATKIRIRMQARFKPKYKITKKEKAREKISRKEIEEAVGRRLDDDEIRKLKRARKEGSYHEALLLIKVKILVAGDKLHPEYTFCLVFGSAFLIIELPNSHLTPL